MFREGRRRRATVMRGRQACNFRRRGEAVRASLDFHTVPHASQGKGIVSVSQAHNKQTIPLTPQPAHAGSLVAPFPPVRTLPAIFISFSRFIFPPLSYNQRLSLPQSNTNNSTTSNSGSVACPRCAPQLTPSRAVGLCLSPPLARAPPRSFSLSLPLFRSLSPPPRALICLMTRK